MLAAYVTVAIAAVGVVARYKSRDSEEDEVRAAAASIESVFNVTTTTCKLKLR